MKTDTVNADLTSESSDHSNIIELSTEHQDILVIQKQCDVDEKTAMSLYVQASMNVVNAILLHVDPNSLKDKIPKRSPKQQHFDKMRTLLNEKDKIMNHIIKSSKDKQKNPPMHTPSNTEEEQHSTLQ